MLEPMARCSPWGSQRVRHDLATDKWQQQTQAREGKLVLGFGNVALESDRAELTLCIPAHDLGSR